MSSFKRDDSYHFSIPFEYIAKNNGNDQYEDATAFMEVDVEWDDNAGCYVISYFCPDEDLIDPEQGNGSIEDFYQGDVRDVVMEELASLGIDPEAIEFGGIY